MDLAIPPLDDWTILNVIKCDLMTSTEKAPIPPYLISTKPTCMGIAMNFDPTN